MLDQMPENLRTYFDTEAFARDMVLGGDITQVRSMAAATSPMGSNDPNQIPKGAT